MLVFRAILTIEGMGRPLDPTFDLYSVGQELVKELVRNQYSPGRIKKDLLWLAKDSSALLQTLPRQIRWMFRKFNSDDFAFEFKSKNLEDIQDQMSTNSKRESFATVIAGFYISSAIALGTPSELPILGHPSTSVVLFSLGTLFLLRFLTIR